MGYDAAAAAGKSSEAGDAFQVLGPRGRPGFHCERAAAERCLDKNAAFKIDLRRLQPELGMFPLRLNNSS